MTQGDINQRTVLLTGPTSGIGERMLDRLIRHPSRPDLILLARDPAGLASAVDQAHAAGLAAHGILVDLSDLASVTNALRDLAALQHRATTHGVDVALLNAGAQFTTRQLKGAQGFELTFTVNVIAQHLLLRGLQDLLAPSAHAVLMGSSTHRGKTASFNLVPDPIWQDPACLAHADPSPDGPTTFAHERERGGVAHASSKLALVTLSHDWAERFGSAGHRLNVYDPGLVPGTGLGKDMPGYMYWVWKHVMPGMRVLPGATSPARTAQHAVHLAMGDVYPDLNDGYDEIGRLTRAEPGTFTTERRQALWTWLDEATQDYLPAR